MGIGVYVLLICTVLVAVLVVHLQSDQDDTTPTFHSASTLALFLANNLSYSEMSVTRFLLCMFPFIVKCCLVWMDLLGRITAQWSAFRRYSSKATSISLLRSQTAPFILINDLNRLQSTDFQSLFGHLRLRNGAFLTGRLPCWPLRFTAKWTSPYRPTHQSWLVILYNHLDILL